MKYPNYELYKDSGSQYINELPVYWKTSVIKYLVCTPITDGPHETPDFLEDGIPFISAEAIENGRINFNKKRDCISEEQHKIYSKKYKPQRNDVYVVKSGSTTGKVAIVDTDEEFNIWSPLAAIRVNPEKNDPWFIFYALSSDLFQKQVSLFWSLGTQPNIGMSVLQKLKIPTPSLKEQQSIANFLDKETTRLDALIAKKQQLIETLKEKRIAVISQAVTKGLNPGVSMKDSGIEWLDIIPEHWNIIKLKWFSKIYSGGTPDKNNEDFWEDGTIPWTNSGTVNQGYITTPSQYITKEAFQSSSAKWIPKGALVMALAGQGKTKGMVAQLGIKTTCNQSMAAIIPDDRANPRYILYWLMINYQNIRNLGGGNQRDGLNLVMLGNIQCPIPPFEEQVKIVNKLDSEEVVFKNLSDNTQKAIDTLIEYKTALISAAVTGKIKVPEQA